MTMKNKKLVWRLKEQPTADSIAVLVKEGILTKDEAKEILLESREMTGESEGRDKTSLKEEIIFLRELVEKLSQNKPSVVYPIVKEIEKEVPVRKWPWYEPYVVWSNSDATYNTSGTIQCSTNFSDISTFN